MEQASQIESSSVGINQQSRNFSRHAIYGKFSLVLLGLMVITVLPHYAKVFDSSTTVSAALIIHSMLFLGWYILFAIQSNLSAAGSVTLHRKLGYASMVFFAVLIFSGTELLIEIMRSYDASWDSGYLVARTSFVFGILHTIFSFSIFYILAVIYRKQLQAHKRFMLMASLSMISASITRVAFLPWFPLDGMAVTLLSTYGFLLVPVIMDRLNFGRVHPTLKWSVPTYILTQIICIGILPTTQFGQLLAFPF